MADQKHQEGDLVLYSQSKWDGLKPILGILVQALEEDDEYKIYWLGDYETSGMYNSSAIRTFKRNLKLYLGGFE